MWNSFEKDKKILEDQFSLAEPVLYGDIDLKTLSDTALAIYLEDPASLKNRGRVIKYLLENVRIGITPEDFFPMHLENNCRVTAYTVRAYSTKNHNKTINDVLKKHADAVNALCYEGISDYSHTAPDWSNLLSLGITGLKARAKDKQGDFYEGVTLAYEGAEALIMRFAAEARNQTREQERMSLAAQSLEALTKRAPENIYEALCLILVYFMMQSNIECSFLRSFGSLDMLLYPFYERDLNSGTFTKEQIRTLIRYFIQNLEAQKVWANQPFALCGTEGQPAVNELSYIILDEFIALKPIYTKIHIRYSPALPDDFFTTVCKSIRNGANAFVFINNAVALQALEKFGISRGDAVDYGIVGCYEIFAQGTELPCTSSATVNMPKALSLVINGGIDSTTGKRLLPESDLPRTFDEFIQKTEQALSTFIDSAIELAISHEKGFFTCHFSPFLSSTYDCAMEQGKDLYHGGAKYNSSSINFIGTASIADSLYAVKKLVYDEGRVTLDELKAILNNNWQGHDELRRYALSLPKYGNNSQEVDSLARRITDYCLKASNGRKNGRGGAFRGGTWSIDTRVRYGEKTSATPDGRLCGEPLSKNVCATNAHDRNGVTAHILSALKLDYTLVPNGTVLDLSFNHTAVSGEDGLNALKASIKTFMLKNGFATQINVLDPAVLKAAQSSPEQYRTLQVRLCGWNARFTDLARIEQDQFIAQSEVL